MALKNKPHDVLTIDPVAMNVVNRVAPNCKLEGQLQFDGGLLVQGELTGTLNVKGHLIVWHGGAVRGRVKVQGDLYVFGQLGPVVGSAVDTWIECTGTICVAQSGVANATLVARRLQLYEGATVGGPFKTLRNQHQVPVLQQELSTAP